LIKSIICFREFRKNGSFPNVKEKYGHNLKKLKEEIISICVDMDYQRRCEACAIDFKFLSDSEVLNKIVDLLSIFGQKSRYYDFDKLSGIEINYDNPYEVIEEIEKEVVSKNKKLQTLQFADRKYDEFVEELNSELRKLFRRFARTLCRLFTLGDLGEAAEKMIGHISEFLYLQDSEL